MGSNFTNVHAWCHSPVPLRGLCRGRTSRKRSRTIDQSQRFRRAAERDHRDPLRRPGTGLQNVDLDFLRPDLFRLREIHLDNGVGMKLGERGHRTNEMIAALRRLSTERYEFKGEASLSGLIAGLISASSVVAPGFEPASRA